MLDYKQIRNILNSFPLEEYEISNNRLNYKYKGKVVVCELYYPTGNCYVWGRDIAEYSNKYPVKDNGWIPNIIEYSEEELRDLLTEVINYRDKLSQ